MKQNTLLHAAFAFLVVISALQFAALQFSLYYFYPWYDIMMHFLGGIFVALILLWLFFYSEYIERFEVSKRNIILIALLGTLVVGIGWEVFEYSIGNVPEENYMLDTSIDLFMDLIGASLVLLFLYIKNPSFEGND